MTGFSVIGKSKREDGSMRDEARSIYLLLFLFIVCVCVCMCVGTYGGVEHKYVFTDGYMCVHVCSDQRLNFGVFFSYSLP